MADRDYRLGYEIHELFKKKNIESPLADNPIIGPTHKAYEVTSKAFANILTELGLDLKDPSIQDTPRRVAKMYVYEVFAGLNYENFPKCTAVPNDMGADEMVLSRNCIVRSTCEHHFQPIYGRCHIGYIPGDKVLGLSKLNRVADFFARRPQVQERLTIQIYEALSFILQTPDVAVVIEADHFCVKMRGIEDACSDTVTSKMGGRFMSNPALRAEFMSLIGGRNA